jgi:hypothetical protein
MCELGIEEGVEAADGVTATSDYCVVNAKNRRLVGAFFEIEIAV